MIYILKSTYNDKLYQQLKSRGLEIHYTCSNDLHMLNEEDRVIIDMVSHENELHSLIENHNSHYICMGDETRVQGKINYVSKYQTIDTICSLIFNRQNHVIIIIGSFGLFERLQAEYKHCNFVDFTYNSESDLSLIEILDNCEDEIINKMKNSKEKILYPISNIMDLLDPPVKYFEDLISSLKRNRDTILYINHLKGPLDLLLLRLSDLIIFVHKKSDANTKRFEDAIGKAAKTKKIISLQENTKGYDQFKLSEHTLI